MTFYRPIDPKTSLSWVSRVPSGSSFLFTAKLYQVARVTHVVNGVRGPDATRLLSEDRRARVEADRRTGLDRRVKDVGRPEGDRRAHRERRIGPRRVRDGGDIDLVGAARRARERADAAFSHFKVGAALEALFP